MNPAPGALLVMAVVMFLPGALLYWALLPQRRSLECLALAPTLSLAITFILGEVTTFTGLSFGPPAFIVTLGILGIAAFGARLRSFRNRRIEDGQRERPSPGSRDAGVLLVAGILLGGITWLSALHGVATTPPKRDSANHGVMAARIARLETIDSAHVLASDIPGGRQQAQFYPLALHGEVALAHRLAGIPIADGLLGATILFAALVLPLGLFVLTRFLVPEDPRVAGLTALLVAGVVFFPFFPIDVGAIPLIAGLAMIPASCVVMARYLVGGGRSEGAVAAFITIGTFSNHSSEVALLFIVSGCLLGEAALRSRAPTVALVGAGRALRVIALTVLLLLPILGAVAGGAAERSGIENKPTETLGSALGALLGLVSFPWGLDNLLVGLAVVGISLSVSRRRHVAMTCLVLSQVILYFMASTLEGPFELLTLPWYQQAARIAYNLALPIPFFGAVALIAGTPWLGRQVSRYLPSGQDGVVAITVTAVLLAIFGCAGSSSLLRLTFESHVFVDRDALAAFDFLRKSVGPRERVLNDRHAQHEDGGMWMYPFQGVPPVFTLEPSAPDKSWQERLWLLDHVSWVKTDPRVLKLLEKYNVRYVYLNNARLPSGRKPEHRLYIEDLWGTPGVCERFHQGTSYVFELVAHGVCS